MTPTIRIDDEVFVFLKKHAEPFVDSPNDVLRRLLGLDGASSAPAVSPAAPFTRQDRIRIRLEEAVASDPDLALDDSNKVWIHFAPRSWIAPELMRGLTKSGRILRFLVENRPTRLTLFLELCPGDQRIRAQIRESLRNERWFRARRHLAPQWYRMFRKDILVPQDYTAHGDDTDWILNRVTQKLAEFKSTDFPQIDEAVRAIEF